MKKEKIMSKETQDKDAAKGKRKPRDKKDPATGVLIGRKKREQGGTRETDKTTGEDQ
jgi:hypothetical protein